MTVGNSAAVPLTWLYVPGDRSDRVGKALAGDADVVIVDLEDAVLPTAKALARQTVSSILSGIERPVQVRVNAPSSPWGADDLTAVRGLPPRVGVRIPRCESAAEIAEIAHTVGDRALHILVESALGLERAVELATAHPRVTSVGLGEADLRAQLGVSGDVGLGWARGRIVNAAAAGRLPSPAMSVFAEIRDSPGLAASCRIGRALGFVGQAAIPPVQLSVIRECFTPTAAEIRRAREVVEAAEAGESSGHGAVALPDGRFVDPAIVLQARRVLLLATGR
ncbi:MAG: HpcH/HpaI aldolase/citrate lyase family protein [Nakamurella sp.]